MSVTALTLPRFCWRSWAAPPSGRRPGAVLWRQRSRYTVCSQPDGGAWRLILTGAIYPSGRAGPPAS